MIVAEVAITVAVVGWFVSPNISKLIEVAHACAASRYKWHAGLPEKLQKLAEDLEVIRDTVDAARMGFINDKGRIGRLWILKDAIHDVEEIMDAFEYEVLEANLGKKRYSSARQAVDFAKQVLGTKESLNQLKKLVKRLGELRQSSQDLRQASQAGVRPIQRPTTTPLSPNDVLFGYDKEYAQLLSKLVPPPNKDEKSNLAAAVSKGCGDPRVVAITGHGGMGKTELARRAFNDQEQVRGRFDLFIWVCAYAKFTKTELLREIWRSAAGAKPVGDMNDTSIEEELIKMVAPKRCLLVIDDVCNDESMASEFHRKQTWDGVLAPFKKHGSKENRILMTTRAKICSATLDAGASIVLNGIDDQAITLLLKKTAFGDQHTRVRPELQQVLENSVGRLLGSPLAAKAAVNDNKLKNSCSTSRWEETLMRDHHDNVVYTHLSSYQDLAPQLQRCYAFCSIFPLNWRFEPEKLTKMWMAHGFVEDTLDGKSMEDVARGYFDDLVSRSLFQEHEARNIGGDKETNKPYYVIHEHIHSMIRQVSAKYCISITDTGTGAAIRIPATARHLSVASGCLDQLKAFSGRLNNLRTLLVLKDDPSSTSSPLSAINNDILKEFKGVRVLDLTDTCITQLPESIGELKHLRYLDLPSTMRDLCDQVTRLLFLQTFGVSKKCKLDKLPDDMSSLINMRHLDIDIGCIAQIGGIGRLDKLQGSVEFQVGKGKKGHSMSELAGMNSLRKTLSIKGLDTVTSNKEAKDALLTRKKLIKVLKLEWGHLDPREVGATDESSAVAVAVLEGLQPHPNLHELRITRYPGTMSPTWLANSSVLENLTRLYLRNCRKVQTLPPVGQLPRLKILDIKELPSIEKLGSNFCNSGAFLSLEKITLDDMQKLVAWDDEECSGDVLFPLLREVRIFHCPLLYSLSALGCCRRSLMSLCVENCPSITKMSLPTNFTTKGFPSLARLHIVGCTLQLQGLPEGGVSLPPPLDEQLPAGTK